MAYYTERRSDYAWNWFLILLLPLFFLFGWVANDYTQNRVTQPQPGVGGGPPETRDLGATVTPTATPTEEPTPTTVITPTVEETKTPEITE